MSAQTPSIELPGLRPLTSKEQVQRAAAFACLADDGKPSCSKVIWTSIFFDGTNNNLKRDSKDNSYSNVVVLYQAHKNDDVGDFYRYYIPGVGTPFPLIGEMHETSDGKSQAKGGEARIQCAMIQVYNAVHRAVIGSDLVNEDEILGAVRALHTVWLGIPVGDHKKDYFERREKLLKLALRRKKGSPKIKLINLSVFGFSRGAAQARTFCNWLLKYCCKQVGGGYTFCGIPIRFQFLGIFDTVASVGLADSSPIGSGLMDWADGTMRIPEAVERTVHYVAAHEIRQNFPLSTGRDGASYPSNCIEVVYPGAHSDVGGGYGPGEQGKAVAGRAHLVSQVPLVNMYLEAVKSGVPLMNTAELKHQNMHYVIEDLQIDPILAQRFNEYAKWSKVGAQKVESMLFEHMRLYWRWRLWALNHFYELKCYNAANEQDRIDMEASDHDFRESLKAVDEADLHARMKKTMPTITAIRDGMEWMIYDAPKAILAVRVMIWGATINDEKMDPTAIAALLHDRDDKITSPLVYDFFDQHVHDSHASFRLLGPLTLEEKLEAIDKVKEKLAKGEDLNPLEQRVMKQVRAAELGEAQLGSFPPMRDDDLSDLREMTDLISRDAVRLITTGRRESGSILRRRRVFDKS